MCGDELKAGKDYSSTPVDSDEDNERLQPSREERTERQGDREQLRRRWRTLLFCAACFFVIYWTTLGMLYGSSYYKTLYDGLPPGIDKGFELQVKAVVVTIVPAYNPLFRVAGRLFRSDDSLGFMLVTALGILAWSILLWLPMLSVRWRRIPIWAATVVQVLMLTAMYCWSLWLMTRQYERY